MTRALACAALLILTRLAAACGMSDDEPVAAMRPAAEQPADPQPRTAERPARRGTTIRLVSSQYGRILGDGRGQAVYLFDRERDGRSECYGACARAWPPVLAKGTPVAGRGARSGLLGTTRRRDGRRQVTYRGQPLYYYVSDAPGRVLCHDVREFGGLWLVVRSSGVAVD
jgi:predicted lipoprotein with Yx(FWY)xxD motif